MDSNLDLDWINSIFFFNSVSFLELSGHLLSETLYIDTLLTVTGHLADTEYASSKGGSISFVENK